MLIHNYDIDTGQYISSCLADEDPRSNGHWLIPASATIVSMPERKSLTWPYFVNGLWVLKPDFRGHILYRKSDGQETEILSAGISAGEQGLTSKPRPSPEHIWDNENWVLDPAIVKSNTENKVMAEFGALLERANQKNRGKSDAYAAGLLTNEETYYFRQWSLYQMALVKAIEVDTFPESVTFPPDPRDYDAVRKEALAAIKTRCVEATERIASKAEAYAAKELNYAEAAEHEQWLEYAQSLNALPDDARFPDSIAWPDLPRPLPQFNPPYQQASPAQPVSPPQPIP